MLEIDCLDAQGREPATDCVHRWIETFGYTSSSHGFEFISVMSAPSPSGLTKTRRRQTRVKEEPNV